MVTWWRCDNESNNLIQRNNKIKFWNPCQLMMKNFKYRLNGSQSHWNCNEKESIVCFYINYATFCLSDTEMTCPLNG